MNAAEIWWSLAIFTGTGASILLAIRAGLDCRTAYWAALAALMGGVAGGLVLGLYDYGLPEGPFNPLAQGKSFLGGLFGGALVAFVYLRSTHKPVGRYGDVLVTALALSYGIGRIGCFFNGCDYGVRTQMPWGHSYPPGTEAYAAHLSRGWISDQAARSLPVHPVQLYAAACGLVIFGILLAFRPRRPGGRVFLFGILYGIYRFGIEFLRGDFHPLVLGLSLPQMVSILLVAGGCIMLLWRQREKATHRFSTGISYSVSTHSTGNM